MQTEGSRIDKTIETKRITVVIEFVKGVNLDSKLSVIQTSKQANKHTKQKEII